ncbi:hypothetical protein TNCV_1087491 [Trichonephila clavipes]|nr:hypothetical protein TNCV_1087491 [Trichonephila clavipes]
MMHLSRGKLHSQLCWRLQWETLCMAKNADMHYMYDRANGNGRAELRVHHVQFFDRRMKDHRIIQWSHRQLHETRSLYVTRYDADRRRHVRAVQAWVEES